MPPEFGDGRPVELSSPPGFVTLMIKRVPNDFARAISEGIFIYIGRDRIV
jgi:hypothetical protein